MILDLARTDCESPQFTDILIIGAGTCGLLLASNLRARGLRVHVLESGGLEQTEPIHPLNRVVQLGTTYRGAAEGRFRCLGGTSTRWGGALIPFLPADLEARPKLGLGPWPVRYSELAPFIEPVEEFFGLDPLPYNEDFIALVGAERQVPKTACGLTPRFAKWPRFSKRNVANLLRHRIERDPDLRIWLNATATCFDVDETSNRARGITARHESGRSLSVQAAIIVICAGAVETTRLLLLLDAQHENRIFGNRSALGRYFHDHMSVRAAYLRARNVFKLNQLAGFRFVGSTMRSFRLELEPEAQRSDRVPGAFAHISVQPEAPSGFDDLRNLLRHVQRNQGASVRNIIRVASDLPFVIRAAYWRFINRQLYWPKPAAYELHIVGEQLPRSENRITLANERDKFGRRLAAIDWKIIESDALVFSAMKRHIDAFWNYHHLNEVAQLDWATRGENFDSNQLAEGSDIFHPGGSTRMGDNKDGAVVNERLQTFAVPNLYVLSTSTFPSGASANPTMMLLLLTIRLANEVARLLGRNSVQVGRNRRLGREVFRRAPT